MTTTTTTTDHGPVEPTDEVAGRRTALFVCSSGGHLAQLLELDHWWRCHDRHWVTFDLPDARGRLANESFTPAYYPTTRNVHNAVRNFFLARRVIADVNPDVVVSNGAAVAVPFFLEARRKKIPTVFIEVYDRVDSRTLTGRLVRPIATSFLVQWPEQQALYRGSILIGTIY